MTRFCSVLFFFFSSVLRLHGKSCLSDTSTPVCVTTSRRRVAEGDPGRSAVLQVDSYADVKLSEKEREDMSAVDRSVTLLSPYDM